MSMFSMVLMILFSFIAFVLGVFYLLAKYKRITLTICSFFILIGFGLYTAGYLSFGEGFAHTLLAALRGLFSTARMFIMSHDYGVIASVQGAQWLTENIWLQILFWLAHVSAAIVMQAVLFSLFGQKMMESFRLRFGLHKEVYIIKGSDINALMLGENIATHDMTQKSPDPKRLVLFLLEENRHMEQSLKKAVYFGGIARVLNRKNDLRHYLDKAGFGKWRSRRKKYHVILMPEDTSVPDDALDVAEYAKEKAVTSENLDIFVIVSSEFEWIREQIESFTQNQNARSKFPCTFHMINEMDLLVRAMLEKHPPYQCKGLRFSGGIAKRQFNAMILGLGDVGKQALLHLIMNGQFITKDRSRMRAIVVDKEKDHACGSFWSCYPALKPPLNLVCEIKPESCDVWSEDFLALLDKWHDIDYIIVALNGNKENKDVARIIRQYYKSKGTTLPVIAVSEKNEGLHRVQQGDVFTFGCREEIYKDAVIIREKTDRVAKAIHNVYGGLPPWHALDWFRQESNRAMANFIPAMLKLANISEEKAIEEEALTEDPALAEVLAETEHLRWNAFHAAMGYETISIDEMQKRFGAYNGDSDPLEYARRDSGDRLHVCLAPWNDLDAVSETYRELAHRTDNKKEQMRDFKANDRSIVQYIPKFLRAARGER